MRKLVLCPRETWGTFILTSIIMREELLKFAVLNGIKKITLQLINGDVWIFEMVNYSVEEIDYQFYLKGTVPIHYTK
jgi:hypothetical protein